MKVSTTNVENTSAATVRKTKREPLGKCTKILAAAAWIGLWQIVFLLLDKPLLLPSPLQVLQTLFRLGGSGMFWITVGASLGRILLAFGLAVALGYGLAALAAVFPGARILLAPPMAVIRATPVASFTILVLVWVSSRWLPVLMAFMMVLPMVYENVYEGIQSCDPLLLEMGQVYGFSRWKKLRFFYFPAVLPFFTSACINGMGFAWKSGIAAEVLGLPRLAIGRQIHDAKIYLEIPELFAWTVVIILFSMALKKLLLALMGQVERRVLLRTNLQAREGVGR